MTMLPNPLQAPSVAAAAPASPPRKGSRLTATASARKLRQAAMAGRESRPARVAASVPPTEPAPRQAISAP
jgi:hypothetical protein